MGENMETTTSNSASTVKIGGCEGPEAMYVKLISADDHEFIIKREHALASRTIKVRRRLCTGNIIYHVYKVALVV